jgi:hypothetical protein
VAPRSAQRARIGELLGHLRDTQREHDTDAVQRLTAENATLRQRLRDLSASSRTLEERLQAARPPSRTCPRRVIAVQRHDGESGSRKTVRCAIRSPASSRLPGFRSPGVRGWRPRPAPPAVVLDDGRQSGWQRREAPATASERQSGADAARTARPATPGHAPATGPRPYTGSRRPKRPRPRRRTTRCPYPRSAARAVHRSVSKLIAPYH